MNFNDNTFIKIAKILGYNIEQETIETTNFDKEEIYLDNDINFLNIPPYLTCFVGLVAETESLVFSIYLDKHNLTTEGIVEILIINQNDSITCIDKQKIKEVVACLTIKDI